MPTPDQWLQMRSVDGTLLIFVSVADKRAEIPFAGHDLLELKRVVDLAIAQGKQIEADKAAVERMIRPDKRKAKP